MFKFISWCADSKFISIITPMAQPASINFMHLNRWMKLHIKYFSIGENVKFAAIIIDTFLKFSWD